MAWEKSWTQQSFLLNARRGVRGKLMLTHWTWSRHHCRIIGKCIQVESRKVVQVEIEKEIGLGCGWNANMKKLFEKKTPSGVFPEQKNVNAWMKSIGRWRARQGWRGWCEYGLSIGKKILVKLFCSDECKYIIERGYTSEGGNVHPITTAELHQAFFYVKNGSRRFFFSEHSWHIFKSNTNLHFLHSNGTSVSFSSFSC